MRDAPITASCLFVFVAGIASASETWQTQCAEPAAMPAVEVVTPIIQPGKWKGKGFGDKSKVDVDIEECGLKIVGLVGVRLRASVPKMVPLELDEDDGRYKASFTYSEGGPAVVVTWDLEAESASRITGRMTIMGRGDQVEADLLEAAPSDEQAACECAAVQNRRDDLDARLAAHTDGSGAARADADWGFATDPDTCAIRQTPHLALTTQATLDALMGAEWRGELVHHERCCSVYQAAEGDPGGLPATYPDWMKASTDEYASDETAALTEQIRVLDTWLENRCN